MPTQATKSALNLMSQHFLNPNFLNHTQNILLLKKKKNKKNLEGHLIIIYNSYCPHPLNKLLINLCKLLINIRM